MGLVVVLVYGFCDRVVLLNFSSFLAPINHNKQTPYLLCTKKIFHKDIINSNNLMNVLRVCFLLIIFLYFKDKDKSFDIVLDEYLYYATLSRKYHNIIIKFYDQYYKFEVGT